MEALILVLEIAIAVVISSVLSPYIPKVSMPLVQIALGIVWFFTPFLPNINIDSRLFLILFIAPLLFFEALSSSQASLKRTLYLSLSLAVGLVLISVVVTGYTISAVLPVIPLAAACALGAALGPTDAVAVSQLGKEAELTGRQMNVLITESLFNDAASIVSFQFAVLALTTGSFSPLAFAGNVIYSFIGGALIGLVMGAAMNTSILMLRRQRLETTTNRILIELIFPFLAFEFAESIHVSGVIAVVAAGLIAVYQKVGVGEDIAQINRVSSAVWQVFTFTLNGSVFVLLGIEIPLAMRQSILNPEINVWALVGMAVLLSITLLAVRFIWISVMLRLARSEETGLRRKMTPQRWHSAAVMTFGGAKGTISLILAFSLPSEIETLTDFPIRTALLFVAALYIIISLLAANIIVPILAPRNADADGNEFAVANLEMLNRTLENIAKIDNPEQHVAVYAIMRMYTMRIARQRGTVLNAKDLALYQEAREETRHWQRDWLEQYAHNHPEYTDACDRLLAPIEHSLSHETTGWQLRMQNRLYFWWLRLTIAFRAYRARVRFMLQRALSAAQRNAQIDTSRSDITRIQILMLQETIHHLFGRINDGSIPAMIGSSIISDLRTLLKSLQSPGLTSVERTHLSEQISAVQHEAYAIELETIRTMLDEQSITREQARMMRNNVFMMQSDSIDYGSHS